jgi:hypothetical protein
MGKAGKAQGRPFMAMIPRSVTTNWTLDMFLLEWRGCPGGGPGGPTTEAEGCNSDSQFG